MEFSIPATVVEEEAAPGTSALGPPRYVPPDVWRTAAELALGVARTARRRPLVAVLRLVAGSGDGLYRDHDGPGPVTAETAAVIADDLAADERVTVGENGDVRLLLWATSVKSADIRLTALARRVAGRRLVRGGEERHLSPTIGWADACQGTVDLDTLLRRAVERATDGTHQLDLVPRRWTPARERRSAPASGALRTWLQAVACLVLGVALPFAALVGLYRAGLDLGTPAYLLVVVTQIIAGTLIWVEGLHAFTPHRPTQVTAHPPATALIAAYLPNEADTIMDTVRAFLDHAYPGRLQIVLAYNTPRPEPVEADLKALAAREPRLVLLKVPYSTSKAQNVNAALPLLEGEFTGLFDADHHPAPGAFARAWRSLAQGADVVQGHCVVRNGPSSWLARLVAVEFEAIYAVSHPGRAQLHGFGLFGGSNGFWRTEVLRGTRLRAPMLTEDIDASFRLLLDGKRVVSDPALVSRELAPTTLGSLWSQRMRWAQGWFQVCRAHLAASLRSPNLSGRQKCGALFLLGWREVHPWLSLQIYPVLAFLIWRAGGVAQLNWAIPVFVLSSLYALSVGVGQVLLAWRLGAPEIRRHRGWFIGYLLLATVFYAEFKNQIARIAQLKELTGERRWPCTPRQA
ncbi:glycosyltransferase [Streptomyces sp. T-3]|nr:glycosyltransferase [Streptomyces sp. T-3]